MATTSFDKNGDLAVINVNGYVTVDDIAEAVKIYYPQVSQHLVWNFLDVKLDENATGQTLKKLPEIAKEYMPNRKKGKTAYVSSDTCLFGMLRLFSVVAEHSNIQHEQQTFKAYDDALAWIQR